MKFSDIQIVYDLVSCHNFNIFNFLRLCKIELKIIRLYFILSKKNTKMGGACTIFFQKQLVPRGTNCRGWWSCLKLSQISVSTHTVPYRPDAPPCLTYKSKNLSQ